MTIDEYFNEIQEYIKTKIEQPNELDLIIKELDRDNIQAVVNQDFNDNVSIEDCAEKLLKATEVKGGIDVTEAPVLDGDRALNTMERKVLSYKDFVNENFEQNSPSAFGGTKNSEYRRSIELFSEIFENQGVYYALSFLYDSQYDKDDIKKMMELCKPGKK